MKIDICILSSGGGGTPEIFLIQCRAHSTGRWDSNKRVCMEGGSSRYMFSGLSHKNKNFRIFFYSIRNVIFKMGPKMAKIRRKYKNPVPRLVDTLEWPDK